MISDLALIFLPGTLYERLAGALLSSLWEGLLLTYAVAICLRAGGRTSARLRFSIWMALFVVLAAMPVLNLLASANRTSLSVPLSSRQIQIDYRWSYLLLSIWVSVAVVRGTGLLLEATGLRSIWRSAVKVPLAKLQADTTVSLHLAAPRSIELCTSTAVDRPSVIGFFAPRILIPAWLFGQLTPEELYQIVLHEVQHLKRHDDWLNLLQKIGLVLFPLNPALFWVDRRLGMERELACDARVIELTRAPIAYATCLMTVTERRLRRSASSHISVLALGALDTLRKFGTSRTSVFSRRVESILRAAEGRSPSNHSFLSNAGAHALAATVFVGLAASSIAMAHAPQLIAFTAGSRPMVTTASAKSYIDSAIPPTSVRQQRVAAQFDSADFHEPRPNAPHARTEAAPRRLPRLPKHLEDVQHGRITDQAPAARWMLVTSWEQTPTLPVWITLPDGRTLFARGATTPVRAGWLFIQL